MADFNVGDVVITNAEKYYKSRTKVPSYVKNRNHTVYQIKGDRVVIDYKGVVIGAVPKSSLTLVSQIQANTNPVTEKTKSAGTDKTKPKEMEGKKLSSVEDYLTKARKSLGIETGLEGKLNNSFDRAYLKYTTRLFGLPYQFNRYTDYRAHYSEENRDKETSLGRKFVENIVSEAPVITIVPGKPIYLPAAKDKEGVSYAVLNMVNENFKNAVNIEDLKKNKKALVDKLKWYDFQPDYYEYSKYVNIMCSIAATFLGIGDELLDGVKLNQYDWKNYRWNKSYYETASSKVQGAIGFAIGETAKSAAQSFIDFSKAVGTAGVETLFGMINNSNSDFANTIKNTLGSSGITKESLLNGLKTEGDDSKGKLPPAFNGGSTSDSFIRTLENLLAHTNYVQFYVDPSSSVNDTASNTTSTSTVESTFDKFSQLGKEMAFLANSAGNTAFYRYLTDKSGDISDSINAQILESLKGNNNPVNTISGTLQRILSAGTSTIMGDKIVFPEIYQNSKFDKNYSSIVIDLRALYGTKIDYFINVVVPLMHILGLALPKQTSANTYTSPFLIKAYIPGVLSCNLGMISQIQVDKNPNGDTFTVDGYPNNIKVTISIQDLYSDLTMTPSGDIMLFISNSSLIEYIATNCGINLVTPQLKNRVELAISTVKQSLSMVDQSVNMALFGQMEPLLNSLVNLY